jgi:EAL domain-containing protein (putative c-di-GMP-specific phosphodiesterase class I)
MHTNAMIRLHLEGDLRRGIETLCSDEPCQFQLHYQPIISLKNGYLAGFEALLRWAHPERGWVSPLEFIPAAEETGLIAPLGRWVIYEACRQFCQWQQEIGITEDITMSVNVSSRQFLQPDFVWQIQEVLQLTQVDPARIKVEITESGLMETVKTVMVKLEQLKDLGIRLSLDDFGTGYSSLSYLHRFPIDTLKIDGSFVSGLHDGQAQIVQTIITLAHGLEMDAIAEGIETPAQAKLLRAMGCEFGQGYLFSRPVPAKAVEQLFKNPQLFDYSN